MTTDPDTSSSAGVAALRSARRANRAAEIDWFEAVYRAYILALSSGIAVLFIAGWVGGVRIDAHTADQVRRLGPAAAGVLVALLVAGGARSGGRGGPLGFEQADVRYLLLAPIPRAAVVRPMAFRTLRAGAFAGAVVGAITGTFASHRLPGATMAWIAAGAAFGTAAALLAAGSALTASGRRVGPRAATAAGGLLVAWSVVDLVTRHSTSPLTGLGHLALAPLGLSSAALVAVGALVAVVVAIAGLRAAAGLSVEAAERRSKLVGELRFAATLRDVRTVLVLQRQLAQDHPRTRPWVRLRPGTRASTAVWRRGWNGALRWPATRVLRLALLGAVAGLSLVAVWHGNSSMLAVAAAAMWTAALGAAEPLAQELDHPSLLDSYPLGREVVFVRHLAVPAAIMLVPAASGIAVALPFGPASLVLTVAAGTALPAVAGAVCGAAVTIIKGPPPPFTPQDFMVPPEFAAIRKMQQLLLPVVIAGLGLATVLAARHTWEMGQPLAAGGTAVTSAFAAASIAGLTILWIRSRDQWVKRMADL